MLVIRRKPGEAFVLADTIYVYILAVEGERVKVGIEAPPDIIIAREELLDRPKERTAAIVEMWLREGKSA
jgi:carbon storage regulator